MKKLYTLLIALLLSGIVSGQWVQQETDPICDFNGLSFVDENIGWMIGNVNGTSKIFNTVNGGQNWTHCQDMDSDSAGGHIYFSDENNGWYAKGPPYIQPVFIEHTTNGSSGCNAEWADQETYGSLTNLFFLDNNNGWYSTFIFIFPGWEDHYDLYKTSDGGNNWERAKSGMWIYDMYFVNENEGFIANQYGLSYTNDGGYNWSSHIGNYSAWRIFFTNTNTGWIVDWIYETNNSIIMHTNDGGYSVEVQVGDTIPKINDIVFTDSLNGWAVGDSGTILHTSNGGIIWEYQESGTMADLHSVCFTNENVGWICGDSGIILHTDNGGIVGVKDIIAKQTYIKIYPNPSSTQITIELPTTPQKNTILTIYNLNGQQLITQPITKPQTEIDISHLPVGIYIIKVWNDKDVMVEKVIKQ